MKRWLAGLLVLAALPSVAHAQASIAGVVKDASGGVLPGVTVEAASPSLIEKSRTVVTDGTGQFKIVDLRPGTYAVTFTLTGFSTVKRDGIELTGSFTASVNADLKVGSIEETITVTRETPVVDLQNSTQQRVLGKDVIDAIPSSRTHFSVGALVPAVQTNNGGDIGGTNAINHTFLTAHGGRTTDQRITLDGLSTNNAEGSSQFSGYLINMGSTQELAVDFAAGTADQATGGVRVNVIPREGGNSFHGTFFAGGMGGNSLQASNYTTALQAAGLPAPQAIKKIWDINPGFGGPLLRDKLWFYASGRTNGEDIYGGGFANLNAGNPNAWLYVPDTSQPTFNHAVQKSLNGRVTWQASAKNKFNFFYDEQNRCWCPRNLSPLQSPEAVGNNQYPYSRVAAATWTSPATSRVLLEAGMQYHPERWQYPNHPEYGDLVGINDQGTGIQYHGQTFVNSNGLHPRAYNGVLNTRAGVSYVTGAHAFKFGFTDQHATRSLDVHDDPAPPVTYRFNNGVPNQITERSTPFVIAETIKADLGIYAQDKWTVKRLTASVGLRFDYFNDYFPEQSLGASPLTPNRNISFAETPWVHWKDLTPRVGVVYDLFGAGKTAVKASINKYMNAYGLQGTFGDGSNPINLTSNTVTRAWHDDNKNFIPDCDLVNPQANGECAVISDLNFGNPKASASVDPAILNGWGVRGYNWEFSAGVQHEILPRVSVDFGYFRRWYGNFVLVDNLATTAADYTAFSIPAPVDSRLPNGGGYTVSGLYDLNQNRVGQVNNYFTSADKYGNEIEHWNGFDLAVNTRLGNGFLLQAGLSSGRTVTDVCDILASAPEAITGIAAAGATAQVAIPSTNQTTYCSQNTGFLTQYKGFGSYQVPRVGVQVSASFSSVPGPALAANYVATNAIVSPSLGRNLSGGAANATVNLVAPGAMYGDRVNDFDVRIGKLLTLGRTKTLFSVDLYNLFNVNPITAYNQSFSLWLQPTGILQARFVKFGVQFDF